MEPEKCRNTFVGLFVACREACIKIAELVEVGEEDRKEKFKITSTGNELGGIKYFV